MSGSSWRRSARGVALLGTVLAVSGVFFPFQNWVYFAIEMLFLGLAVYANATGNAQPPQGFPVGGYAPLQQASYGVMPGGYSPLPGGFPQQPPAYPPTPPMPPAPPHA